MSLPTRIGTWISATSLVRVKRGSTWMIVDRFLKTREETWQEETPEGDPARRTMGIANLGGATLDNEENYLIKKLFTALGAIQIENQARI